jgi:hypothetical protein
MTGEQEFPYRVVDGRQAGWLHAPDGEGDDLYKCFPALPKDRTAGLVETYWPLSRIVAIRGPIRPVVAPTEGEMEALRDALGGAGKKAVATAMVVLYELAKRCALADRAIPDNGSRLVAGRPGSWESEAIRNLAWNVGADIKTKRVDTVAMDACLHVLGGWLFDDKRYVELAETFDAVLGEVVDDLGGWFEATDQWIGRHNRMLGCTGTQGCSCHQERIKGYVTFLSTDHSPLQDKDGPCTCHDKVISYQPLVTEPGTWPCPSTEHRKATP